jgi:hypothetical protein
VQTPSTNAISIVVTDNSSPPLGVTNTFTVVVNNTVSNNPPLLSPISNRTVAAGTTVIFTNLASDPNPADTLTFSLNPGAPPAASVHPVTGVFSWTTANTDTNAVHSITVKVTDNGTPPLSATAGFSVTVLPPPPPNHSPLLFPVDNTSARIGTALTFTNLAYDQDPQDTLTFSLDPGAPVGAAITPVSGVFHWIPTDGDSNMTRYITIRVTDDGQPPKSASATFSVMVLPRLSNNPPVISPIANRTVHAGTAITFTNSASDPDPGDDLSFSLDNAAPPSADIDVLTGVFTWTPSAADNNTTNSITVQVTDDGDPPLSASAAFSVVVRPQPLLGITISGNTATLVWNAISNATYQVQSRTNISAATWQPAGPPITATNSLGTASDIIIPAVSQRFYRLSVMP